MTEFGKERGESLKGMFLFCIYIYIGLLKIGLGIGLDLGRVEGEINVWTEGADTAGSLWITGLSDKEIEEKITGLVKNGV